MCDMFGGRRFCFFIQLMQSEINASLVSHRFTLIYGDIFFRQPLIIVYQKAFAATHFLHPIMLSKYLRASFFL